LGGDQSEITRFFYSGQKQKAGFKRDKIQQRAVQQRRWMPCQQYWLSKR